MSGPSQGGAAAPPVLESLYVPMRDGVRLAVDLWRPATSPARAPCLLLTTRYWRSFALAQDELRLQSLYTLARYFTARGYVVANVDSRGSGASFGVRTTEWSDAEVADITDLIDWIAACDWCNGRVASTGFSYGGNTAFFAAVGGHPALKVIAPQFADYDLFAHNVAPGGIVNAWLRDNWGALTEAMDRNDVVALARCQPEIDEVAFVANVRGPRPVDEDASGALLHEAVREHAANFNFRSAIDAHPVLEDPAPACDANGVAAHFDMTRLSIYSRQAAIARSSVPIIYWASWFDAGTAQGAIDLFDNLPNPLRLVIGPWSHGRRHHQDPFAADPTPARIEQDVNFAALHEAIAPYLFDGAQAPGQGRRIDYYTLGADTWRSTPTWPPQGARDWILHVAPDGKLQEQAPRDTGSDAMPVDARATTGTRNRWHTQIGCMELCHEDRRDEDARLCVFDTQPLPAPLEITGNPVAHLHVSSATPDGSLFVYLEMVAPDGTVKLLSEGQLRLSHRAVASEGLAYRQRAPARRFRRADLCDAPAGAPMDLQIRLLPISIRIPAGWRLRMALAGADADTFAAVAADQAYTIHHGGARASRLTLPVVPA